jgi:hypothetical protein
VPPPAPPAPAAAAAPVDAADNSIRKTKMVAPTDGLSLADRIAKRQAEEKKLADELAGEEKKRLLTYDKTKLAVHQQVFAAIKKVRDAYGKAKTKDDVEKIRTAQRRPSTPPAKMMTIDPRAEIQRHHRLRRHAGRCRTATRTPWRVVRRRQEEPEVNAEPTMDEITTPGSRTSRRQEVAMATVDELQKEHEARLASLLAVAGRGADSNLALVRADPQGVHLAAEQKALEFCALATFLGEMIAPLISSCTARTRAPRRTATSFIN